MSFVPAPGIVTVNAIMALSNERVENTFNYAVSGTIDQAKLKAMCDTYIAWWTSHVGLFSVAVGLLLVYARDLTSQSSQTFEEAPATTLDGTRTSILLPNHVTFAIKRQTGLAGRKNRGRVYWVGITEDMTVSTNQIIAGTASSLATALDALRTTQSSSNGAVEVILHRALGTGTPVIGYTPSDQNIDSQRRRLPGHNRHH